MVLWSTPWGWPTDLVLVSCLPAWCCLLRVPQVGIVTDIWLWYGAFVDVLADFKG